MSQASDRNAILVIAIVRTLADKYGFNEEEALNIAREEIRKEIESCKQ